MAEWLENEKMIAEVQRRYVAKQLVKKAPTRQSFHNKKRQKVKVNYKGRTDGSGEEKSKMKT